MENNKKEHELNSKELDKVAGGCGWCGEEYYITNDCVCCGSCEKACPTGAISCNGEIYVINQENCITCGACQDACPLDAIKMK